MKKIFVGNLSFSVPNSGEPTSARLQCHRKRVAFGRGGDNPSGANLVRSFSVWVWPTQRRVPIVLCIRPEYQGLYDYIGRVVLSASFSYLTGILTDLL